MKFKNALKVIFPAIMLIAALIYTFPNISFLKKESATKNDIKYYTYSYQSTANKIDVKDKKNDKDINFVNQELTKSKNIGSSYPTTAKSVNLEGSFFIVERTRKTYNTVKSICWYGTTTNICLIEETPENKYYVEITPELQKFFTSKFSK